ncbi:hypothetical protein [Pseudomonas sp. UFMG81]|jgi:hypothetical protein|uniref:hypothetical protein n=1 Tax=Pseudomonas sp. UFMG81 TaxID=2745936 RepID=UPI0018904319|nr:hypothetical protein [Pseudomonas sp. UFMG81]
MVFDGFALLNGLWGFICVAVITPILANRKYGLCALLALLLCAGWALLLHDYRRMPVDESLLRSAGVVLLNVAIAFLLVHFVHRKRSLKDLLRR